MDNINIDNMSFRCPSCGIVRFFSSPDSAVCGQHKLWQTLKPEGSLQTSEIQDDCPNCGARIGVFFYVTKELRVIRPGTEIYKVQLHHVYQELEYAGGEHKRDKYVVNGVAITLGKSCLRITSPHCGIHYLFPTGNGYTFEQFESDVFRAIDIKLTRIDL